jgi:hypothetical protein
LSTEHDSEFDSSLQEVVDDVINEMVRGYYTDADSALNEMMNEKKGYGCRKYREFMCHDCQE